MKVHGKRAMLNKPGFESTACIVAEVENTYRMTRTFNNKWSAEPHYTFKIADCDRAIAFELDFETDEGMENSLHKIDTMIAALTAFRAGVATEQVRYLNRIEKFDEA